MILRWAHILPLSLIVVALAGLGFLLGKRTVSTTETEVIERIADEYVDKMGGAAKRTDCAARLAQSDGLWLVVSCKSSQGVGIDYFVDRYGRVAHMRPEV